MLFDAENAKVRSIKLSNAKFYSNVGRHPGGIEFLCSLGFVTNDEAGILRLPFGQSNMSKVLGGLDALRAEADALNIEYSSLPTVVTSEPSNSAFDMYKPQIIRIEARFLFKRFCI